MMRRQEEEKGTSFARSSLLELQGGMKRLESMLSSHEKKLKDKLDDENRTPSHVTFSRVCPHS